MKKLQSHILRNCLEAFKNAKYTEGTLPTDIHDWIKWAENKVDLYDPFVEKYDLLLENIDRDTLIANQNKHLILLICDGLDIIFVTQNSKAKSNFVS